MFLAGDIGGTKTALAIFSTEQGVRQPIAATTFPSNRYASLEEMVKEFLADKHLRVTRASLGVAGPVQKERAQITNLPWVVDARILSQTLGGVPVRLLNDLVAIAHAIPFLESSDLETLEEGAAGKHSPMAVIAPGTGLGEAYLIWDGNRYLPLPSEGGHVDFAPTNPTELELLTYLQARLEHVSYERVCSGKGIPNLYAFLKDTGRFAEPEWLRAEIASAQDVTRIILQSAVEGKADICVETLKFFVSILGSEAGNLALKILATGGVYLAGGIPPRILPQLKETNFIDSFTRKGRFENWLAQVPVYVIVNPGIALVGAACHGLEGAHDHD
ncbi:MAG: glucokinase [Chloroflexi bacterium]|nr:glucokinase [Chloroflexota bacterium]